MTNTEVIKIAEELKVDPADVWNVYLERNIKMDNVVRSRIEKIINESRSTKGFNR